MPTPSPQEQSERAILRLDTPKGIRGMTAANQTKSNGRGGLRAGSGRKPGSRTAKTREIARKAAEAGVSPLEVMLLSMRHHMAEFDKSESLDALANACASAKDAAPYIHPRLASVELDANVSVRSLDKELAELNASAD